MIFFKKKGLFIFFSLFFTTNCIAQYGVRMIKCIQDSNITFPVFIGTDKSAEKEINEYLQTEFFETTMYQTGEPNIFDESRFISDDTQSQTGYTAISYHVELNTPEILSVTFEIEGMGAYPTFHKRYFSFYSKTGRLISAEKIFTTEGLKTIVDILISSRKNKIQRWIKELKIINGASYTEDSSFIDEKFAQCNEEADENSMYVGKESILFYKNDCFPHAWGPFEINLDIKLSFKKLENYLSSFGKKLLFTKQTDH